MKTPIIILAEKFFLDVFRLINQPIDGSDQLERLQKDLSSHLNNIQAQVEQGNSTVNIGEWQSLKKLLIYWSDEVLTQQFPTWEDFILERKYFGERHRAWKFYVEAEECVSKSSADVAEMFYLAVVLGFVGDLEGAFKHELNKEMPGNRHDPAEARKVWAMDLQRRIRHTSTEPPQGEPLEPNVPPLKSDIPKRIAFAAFLISGVLLAIAMLVLWTKPNPPKVEIPDEQQESRELGGSNAKRTGANFASVLLVDNS